MEIINRLGHKPITLNFLVTDRDESEDLQAKNQKPEPSNIVEVELLQKYCHGDLIRVFKETKIRRYVEIWWGKWNDGIGPVEENN